MNSSNLLSNNVILTNLASGLPIMQTLVKPSTNVNTTAKSSVAITNKPIMTVKLTTASPNTLTVNPNSAPGLSHLTNGKVYHLNGAVKTVMATDCGNATVNGNRVITIKTVRAPTSVAIQNQSTPLSAPASPISPVISPVSAPPAMNSALSYFPVSNQPQTPSSAPPTLPSFPQVPPVPRVVPKPIVRIIPKAKSLLSNPNTSSVGAGRRIKANNSTSNPSSPSSGKNSIPGTPDNNTILQEDQVDQAIMLEEVKRLFEEQEEEEFANLETFAKYKPAKRKFTCLFLQYSLSYI